GAFVADRRLVAEPVAPGGLDRSGEHQPDRRGQLAHLDHDGAGLEAARRTAGEAARDIDLRRREHREHLVVSCLEYAQRSPPAVTLASPLQTVDHTLALRIWCVRR